MFRLYVIIDKKNRQACGYWTEGKKLFKDNVAFLYFESLYNAKLKAKQILNNTSEICIAIESLRPRTLYLIYRDKTEILSHYTEALLKNKYLYKKIIKKECYTTEKTKDGIKAFTYTKKKITPKKKKKSFYCNIPSKVKIYTYGREII